MRIGWPRQLERELETNREELFVSLVLQPMRFEILQLIDNDSVLS